MRAFRNRRQGPESLFLRGVTTLEIAPTERECANCHRPFEAHWLPQHVCPRCVDDNRRLTAEEYRLQEATERAARLTRCGLTGELQQMTLESFDAEAQVEAYAAARRFVTDYPDRYALAFLGDIGTGKSHLAAGALLALLDRGVTGRWVNLPTLMYRLRTAPNWQETAAALVAPLFEADVLVLDDFGREKETPSLPEMIDALIDRRWLERAPTIITANLTLAKLTERLGPASASRFLSEAVTVALHGQDWRKSRRVRIPQAAAGDVRHACTSCQGAGWVRDGGVPIGRADRLMRCPSCAGRGY